MYPDPMELLRKCGGYLDIHGMLVEFNYFE